MFKANYAAKEAEQLLIRKRNQEELKSMMTERLGFTKHDIAKLNFKDEAQILQKMKKRHARMINADAARKI